jgi:hypothetical protein
MRTPFLLMLRAGWRLIDRRLDPVRWAYWEPTGEWRINLTGTRREDGEALRAAIAPVLAEMAQATAPVQVDIAVAARNQDGAVVF